MMTVSEVSKRTGLSVRALQYYDRIGLLPAARTEAGYRLYDEAALERLGQIMLYRALDFPLKEIKRILARSQLDRDRALEQQVELLTMRKERLEGLIAFARGVQKNRIEGMDFTVFDQTRIREYEQKAKAQWGDTEAFRAYEEKRKGRSDEAQKGLGQGLMLILTELGQVEDSASVQAGEIVRRLQGYISEHFYPCTDAILGALGELYGTEEFRTSIDAAGGEGTALRAQAAIRAYLR